MDIALSGINDKGVRVPDHALPGNLSMGPTMRAQRPEDKWLTLSKRR